jgi:uncharacterized membrane protein
VCVASTGVSASEAGLAISVFLACAVEAVEALTIVMAVGITRSWPSALAGAAAATATLASAIAAIGAAILQLPIDQLRLAVGALLLMFGLQWLRKAILRASRRKALRDERAAFENEVRAARSAAAPARDLDLYAFAIAFKGVLLEGLEVALIVVSFAANHRHVALAAGAAAAAVTAVILAGIAARSPLSRVPENTMKFTVGVMLSAYGAFWLGEGSGATWPGGEASLIGLAAVILAASMLVVVALRRGSAVGSPAR